MKHLLFIIMMMQSVLCHTTLCKHVSGNIETDNCFVSRIQKDRCGYMCYNNLMSQTDSRAVTRPPLWKMEVIFLFYGIIAILLVIVSVRSIMISRERNLLREIIKIFTNSTREISLPLTLIKSPLENLCQKYSSETFKNILQQVKGIDYMFTNLVTLGRISSQPERLYLLETELTMYLDKVIEQISPVVEMKNIKLHRNGNSDLLRVWIDREKMATIIRGILEMIVYYMDDGERVELTTTYTLRNWEMKIEFADNERIKKKLYALKKRTSTHSSEAISGLLIRRLIQLHKGKINFSSKKKGYLSVILVFPILLKSFSKLPESLSGISLFRLQPVAGNHEQDNTSSSIKRAFVPENLFQRKSKEKDTILLVEENEGLRSFLIQILSEEYNVCTVSEAESACETIGREQPDVIILAGTFTDVPGEALCLEVKSDVKTAHIPVILLKDPLNVGNDYRRVADCCLTLPLDISRLRVEVNNLIFNRDIIRKRYIKLVLGAADMMGAEIENTVTDVDRNFMGKVRKLIEENLSNPNFNIDMLSAEMNMSRSSFYSKIKMATNQAPVNYIRTVRLNRALVLLISRKYTVTEVAELSGFSDAKYFREVFKRYYGESPKKFINGL